MSGDCVCTITVPAHLVYHTWNRKALAFYYVPIENARFSHSANTLALQCFPAYSGGYAVGLVPEMAVEVLWEKVLRAADPLGLAVSLPLAALG